MSKKLTVPKEIKLGARTFKVSYNKDIVYDNNWSGCISQRHGTIEICPDYNDEYKMITLFHEIFHAICYQYNIEIDEKDNDRLANGMAEFLKNNLDVTLDWREIK